MIKKQTVVTIVLVAIVILSSQIIGGAVYAQTSASADDAPSLLPTSPFYFLKEWGRGIQRALTFNPIKKAKLELEITDDKAREVEAVRQKEPNNVDALNKALKNYNGNAERLRLRLESLESTSSNPNVQRLVESLSERVIVHNELFESLAKKHKEAKEANNRIMASLKPIIRKRLASPEQIAKKAKKMAEERMENKEEILVRSLNVINKLDSGNGDENVKEGFFKAKEELVKGLENSESLPDTIKKVVPNGDDRARMIGEIKTWATDKSIRNSIDSETAWSNGDADISPKLVKRAISEASNLIAKVESLLLNIDKSGRVFTGDLREKANEALDNAKEELADARKEFKGENYAEALQHAYSAKALTNKALKALYYFKQGPEYLQNDTAVPPKPISGRKCDLNTVKSRMEHIRRVVANIDSKLIKKLGIEKLIKETEIWLAEAQESYEERDCKRAQQYITRAWKWASEALSYIEPLPPVPSPNNSNSGSGSSGPANSDKSTVCAMIYDPVCGTDGKTYSNACSARRVGIEVARKGACGQEKENPEKKETESFLEKSSILKPFKGLFSIPADK